MEKDNKKIIGDFLIDTVTEDIKSDLDSLLKEDCIFKTANELEDGRQYAFNLIFLEYIYKLYNDFNSLGEENPRFLANIETDKLMDSFRKAIDLADTRFKEKEKEFK